MAAKDHGKPAGIHADQQQPGRPFGLGGETVRQGLDFLALDRVKVMGHRQLRAGVSCSVHWRGKILQIICF
ncbi:hypothetical protein PSH87_21775 [Pseudomonas sp. FP453]|uniref:hypothetical protein n=1 Tax=Pseudomonas sp. FP453 TaxID=2954094 RepID=UPI002733A6B4|nr:hypothetical protein [Pseudomonas sp. FP453]WLH93159.1 hypothetical protein PSH87_21775 [Pseudomonas sp. FP453]